MYGIYEFDEKGDMKLTAEAQQWLRDGKLKLLKQDVFDESGTGIVVDMIFMGYEPCPEVQAILAARKLTPAPEYSWELSYDHAKGETCGYLKDYAALEEAIIKGAGIPAEVIQGSDSASDYHETNSRMVFQLDASTQYLSYDELQAEQPPDEPFIVGG